MTQTLDRPKSHTTPSTPSDWVKILAEYRDPSTSRSVTELALTVIPFVALWAAAWWALSVSYWLAFGIALLIGPFLLRLFTIQYDCGHSSFFRNRDLGDWVGRAIGIFTLTPYDVWRRSHSIHHSSAGNLHKRGIGDILTLTVDEYSKRSAFGRLKYRLYRHPITLFGIGPSYMYLLENRLPLGFMNASKYWVSSMGTNIGILLALSLMWYFGGLAPILLIFLPSSLLAGTAGVWLFYVQHQFENTVWDEDESWKLHDAALQGSSHYVLPSPLQWVTANIGIHHVHHLYSRIPFYRLPEVLRDFPELAQSNRMTIAQSFATVRLKLWDEKSRQLVSFAQARAIAG